MPYRIEKDWITKSGYRAVIIMTDGGYYCGYVGIDKNHPYFGKTHNEMDPIPDVHGGLYFEKDVIGKEGIKDGLWWLGFDCHHHHDCVDMNEIEDPRNREMEMLHSDPYGSFRNLDFVIGECEYLARQLKEICDYPKGESHDD